MSRGDRRGCLGCREEGHLIKPVTSLLGIKNRMALLMELCVFVRESVCFCGAKNHCGRERNGNP